MGQLLSLSEQAWRRCSINTTIPGTSLGTGFFVVPGSILTCAHVVQPARENNLPIEVCLWNGQSIGIGSIGKYIWKKYLSKTHFRDKSFNIFTQALALLQVKLTNQPCVYL